MARFLAEGLCGGEKVVYAVDENSGERVLGYLKKAGIAAEKYIESRQLEIHSTSNVYAPSGRFEPMEMIARIKILCDQAIKEGYPGLRGTGEMTWALRGWPGSERLAEYELRVNAAFAGGRSLALCQYDATKFRPALLQNIKAAHSVVWPKGVG